MNFTWAALQSAQAGLGKLTRRWNNLLAESSWSSADEVPSYNQAESPPEIAAIYTEFKAKLEDDLKTAQAVALMWKLVKINKPEILPALKAMFDNLGLIVG